MMNIIKKVIKTVYTVLFIPIALLTILWCFVYMGIDMLGLYIRELCYKAKHQIGNLVFWVCDNVPGFDRFYE